jgi:dTMP kinase
MDKTVPDLTIILMIKPELGIERIKKNSQRDYNRLDREKINLHQKVYEGYQQILRKHNNDKIISIDASKSIDEVYEATLKVVLRAIKKHYGE